MAYVTPYTATDGILVMAADFNTHTTDIADHETRLASVISSDAGKVPTTRTISPGTGLTGGGDLSANRTLTVAYGTTSTTATVGNDSRVVNGQTAYATTTDASVGNSALSTKLGTSITATNTVSAYLGDTSKVGTGTDGSLATGTVAAQLAFIKTNAAPLGPVVSAYQATAQSIPTSTATTTYANGFQAITLDSETTDANSMHVTTAGSNTKLTCVQAGVYLVGGTVVHGTASGTGNRAAAIYKNGTPIPGSAYTMVSLASGNATDVPPGTVMVTLAVGDYLELCGWQNSGSALSTFTTAPHNSTLWAQYIHP